MRSIELAVRNVGSSKGVPSGLLRINTARIAARYLIEPHLNEFFARYPDLKLELVMDDGLANIVVERCDAGIRLGQSLAPNVVAVPTTPMLEMAVVASDSYFKHYGAPKTPAHLAHHNCVAYRITSSNAIFRWTFSDPDTAGNNFVIEPEGVLTKNDDATMIRAALQGAGVVQHMTWQCATSLWTDR